MKPTIRRVGQAAWIPPRRLRRTLRYRLGLRHRYVESGWFLTGWWLEGGDEPYSVDELVTVAAEAGTLQAPPDVARKVKAL